LRLRVAKRESASVVVPKALAPSFAVPRRPRFRPLACPRARSRRPETNERFLSLASLERSGAPPIGVPASRRRPARDALARSFAIARTSKYAATYFIVCGVRVCVVNYCAFVFVAENRGSALA